MNFTPIARQIMLPRAKRTDKWATDMQSLQLSQLKDLVKTARHTEIGKKYDFTGILESDDLYETFSRHVPLVEYDDIRADVMRMINGETDVLWPGKCLDFAQSSGTSGGRSKFVPITPRSLSRCHYAGASDCVAHYLRQVSDSRLFAGKAFVLGGSFATELKPLNPHVRIGDLSATLINKINPVANLFRVPDKRTALLPDWNEKLPKLVEASRNADITNISGVPSWFLTVIKEVMLRENVHNISEVWPNLEVFFHGGISFEPYREIYKTITDEMKMHFMETYNASEGFFAVQNDMSDPSMLLIIDNDVFYEFIDVMKQDSDPVPAWEVKEGRIYELVITSSNGLWRYRIGDTVRICRTSPLKIRIAGRTKTFINAFGEELMEDNAEHAVAAACRDTGASVRNYTAAPVFATGNSKGRHQWLIEWIDAPSDIGLFAESLDKHLREVNSDYDAKRSHSLFLDPPLVNTVPDGTFDRWLSTVGSGKLGGQRKIPRLSNDRKIVNDIIAE